MGRGRHKLNDEGGREPLQRTRHVPTYAFRLDAVNHFLNYGMESTLEKFYKDVVGTRRTTARKNINLWASDKTGIEFACANGSAHLTRLRKAGAGTTLPADAEQHIVQWLNKYRADGLSVSLLMLERKALSVARDLEINPPYFTASWCWCRSFLHRHKLSLRTRTRQGQIRPADAGTALRAFNDTVRQKMAEFGVDVVYNTDQTPVFFEYLPKSTVNQKGAHTVWVRSGGKDKERLTCMILGDSLGRKYPPFLVVKSKPSTKPAVRAINTEQRHGFGRQLWEEMKTLQGNQNLQIYANATDWWVEALSVAFLRFQFGERADMSTPILLLWDEFSAHWTPTVLACAKELNIELIRVPAGCTSVCQPADVAWNRPLKTRLRRYWVDYLEAQMQEHERAIQESVPFRFSPPNRSVVVTWVADAWRELTSDAIANGFNGVLQEPTASREEQLEMDALIARLEICGLLDKSIGEVEHDVVDAALRRLGDD